MPYRCFTPASLCNYKYWNPKFIDSRVEIKNNEQSTVTVYSTIDNEHFSFNYKKRLNRYWWGNYGLCFETEDGETILSMMLPPPPPEHEFVHFGGDDLLTPEQGARIRREAEDKSRLNEELSSKYDDFIFVPFWGARNFIDGYKGFVQSEKQKIKETKRKAQEGNPDAQYEVGRYYQNGIGVAKDDAEAVKWYRKAAEQGHANAQDNLGWMYQNGYGIIQDYEEAVKWYRKAAEQGHANAQNSLGWMIHNGWGIEQNDEEAIKWLKKAAEQGNSYAQNNLKNLLN